MAETLTPMLAQYRAIKQKHQDVILLFRLGDFYEMFGEDAKIASQVLELVLTSREVGKGRRIPMCGIPYHAADRYLARLLAAGYRAAVCDQVEDPKQTKGLVRREVVRILTPGTVVEEHLLDSKANNYLAAVVRSSGKWGLAAADSSTGEMMVTEFDGPDAWDEVQDELARLRPAEVLVREQGGNQAELAKAVESFGGVVTTFEEDVSLVQTPAEVLMGHFGVAAAVVIAYLKKTQLSGVEQIRGLKTYSRHQFMVVDATRSSTPERSAAVWMWWRRWYRRPGFVRGCGTSCAASATWSAW